MLVDKDAELDSIVTKFTKEVTDTATELLGKLIRKRNIPWLLTKFLIIMTMAKSTEKENIAEMGKRL